MNQERFKKFLGDQMAEIKRDLGESATEEQMREWAFKYSITFRRKFVLKDLQKLLLEFKEMEDDISGIVELLDSEIKTEPKQT